MEMVEVCSRCEVEGLGATAWAGVCHDCDNELEAELMEQDEQGGN